jgi:hypothetical protein
MLTPAVKKSLMFLLIFCVMLFSVFGCQSVDNEEVNDVYKNVFQVVFAIVVFIVLLILFWPIIVGIVVIGLVGLLIYGISWLIVAIR